MKSVASLVALVPGASMSAARGDDRPKAGKSQASKKPQRPNPPKDIVPASHRSNTWHSVSLLTKSTSCGAARALRATRFLSKDAPRLPLAQCTAAGSCPCAYKHHTDRRGPSRRKDESMGLRRSSSNVVQERRVQRDRRKTDQ